MSGSSYLCEVFIVMVSCVPLIESYLRKRYNAPKDSRKKNTHFKECKQNFGLCKKKSSGGF